MSDLNQPMTTLRLFEFKDFLSKDEFKQVDDIFATECKNKSFVRFNTPFDRFYKESRKDYLSYAIASGLVNKTIKNDINGFRRFFKMAVGIQESHRFFSHVIYHTYNLCFLNNQVQTFDKLVTAAKKIIHENQNELPIYLLSSSSMDDVKLKEHLQVLTRDVMMNGNLGYYLPEYSEYHQSLQKIILKNELEDNLVENKAKKSKLKI